MAMDGFASMNFTTLKRRSAWMEKRQAQPGLFRSFFRFVLTSA
jgi:hypothetical protein